MSIDVKYELDVGYRTVYRCVSSRPEYDVIEELRNNFRHLYEANCVQIFKIIKSKANEKVNKQNNGKALRKDTVQGGLQISRAKNKFLERN